MTLRHPIADSTCNINVWLKTITLTVAMTFVIVAVASLQAQTFQVLHAFTGGADGEDPVTGVTLGGTGTLYGTAYEGGTYRDGVVFKIVQRGSGWTLSPLYEFQGGNDGFYPMGQLVIGPNGALYGTTGFGGGSNATGTVFELQPPPTVCKTTVCYWTETILHSFQGGPDDGAYPFYTKLLFDQAGNIYSTTQLGGAYGQGSVFELSPSGAHWTINLLHSFNNNRIDGYEPTVGVIFDAAGNLYGTTSEGGNAGGGGTVFELSLSGGMWTERILYNFPLDNLGGIDEPNDLIMDQSSNLYGSTSQGTPSGGGRGIGNVFKLTRSPGSWAFSTLYNFSDYCFTQSVSMDATGNLYGNCKFGGQFGEGMVFELTNSGGAWTLRDLHDFTGGSDGGMPYGAVAIDSSGNLYGTTSAYGDPNCRCGTVWEITP